MQKKVFLGGCVIICGAVALSFYSSSVTGQGFSNTQGGEVKTCSGQLVILMPSTAQNIELVRKWTSIPALDLGIAQNITTALNLGITTTPEDYAQSHPGLQTRCDNTGNFSFSVVRPGNWIAVTKVFWTNGVIDGTAIADYQGGFIATSFQKSLFSRSNILVNP